MSRAQLPVYLDEFVFRHNRRQQPMAARVPVIIGAGIPLFGVTQRDIALTHVATRQYASGLVQSEYVVAV